MARGTAIEFAAAVAIAILGRTAVAGTQSYAIGRLVSLLVLRRLTRDALLAVAGSCRSRLSTVVGRSVASSHFGRFAGKPPLEVPLGALARAPSRASPRGGWPVPAGTPSWACFGSRDSGGLTGTPSGYPSGDQPWLGGSRWLVWQAPGDRDPLDPWQLALCRLGMLPQLHRHPGLT